MALTDFQPDTGQVSLQIDLVGDTGKMYVTMGVHGLAPASAMTQADADDLCNEWATDIESAMCDVYSISVGTVSFNSGASVGNANQLFAVSMTPHVGNVTTDAVPQNTATLVRKLTGVAGRGANGRFYIPGVPEAEVDQAGVLTGAFVTNVQGDVDQIIGDWAGIAGGYEPVVVHHTLVSPGPPPVYISAANTVITSFLVDPMVATQRRRLR